MGALIFLSAHSIFAVTYSTIIAEIERRNGDEAKYYLALNDQERRFVIESLNQLRNKLIAGGKYTDAADDVLLKIIGVKRKKFKVIYREA